MAKNVVIKKLKFEDFSLAKVAIDSWLRCEVNIIEACWTIVGLEKMKLAFADCLKWCRHREKLARDLQKITLVVSYCRTVEAWKSHVTCLFYIMKNGTTSFPSSSQTHSIFHPLVITIHSSSLA